MTALLEGRDSSPAPEGDGPETAPVKPKHKPKKGDPRIVVQLSELETAVFGDRTDPTKVYGRRKNRRARFVQDKGEWKTVDMESDSEPAGSHAPDQDGDDDTAGSITDGSIEDDIPGGIYLNKRIRAPQTESEINFSAGGGERGWAEKIEETPEMLAKRREGQKRAEEKETVKSAARRAVAFGLLVDASLPEQSGKRRKKAKGEEPEDMPQKVARKCEALMNGTVVEPSFAKGDWSIRWRED